jgi:hypothetical protein
MRCRFRSGHHGLLLTQAGRLNRDLAAFIGA